MFFEAKQIVRWKETRRPHPELCCALCGRKMLADEACLSAFWRAQGGQYIQAYHPKCARVVKLWGYPGDFLSPRNAERWACNLSCAQCDKQISCALYVFQCDRAMDGILLMGGAKRRDEKDEEDGEDDGGAGATATGRQDMAESKRV